MNLTRLFLCLFLFQTFSTSAQRLGVYPVRANHKWGYVKFYGQLVDTIIPPRYDVIGDDNLYWNSNNTFKIKSPYRIFEIDEKVGLLNSNLKEIIPNKYNRIRPISPSYFAVAIEEDFVLMDSSYNILLDSVAYEDICPAGTYKDTTINTFFVKKEGGWGIQNLNQKPISNFPYINIQATDHPNFFSVKKHKKAPGWQLVNKQGQLVLPDIFYKKVTVLSENFMAIQDIKTNLWHCYKSYTNSKQQKSFKKSTIEYTHVQKLSPYFVFLAPFQVKQVEVWNIETQKPILNYAAEIDMENNPSISFAPLADSLFIRRDLDEKGKINQIIVNHQGRRLSTEYDIIEKTNKNKVFKVGKKGLRVDESNSNFMEQTFEATILWGLFKDTSLITRCVYSEISDFKDNIASLQFEDKFGAVIIHQDSSDILQPIFDNISQNSKGQLQAQTGNDIVFYTINKEGKFELQDQLQNAWIISENISPIWYEIPPCKKHKAPDTYIQAWTNDRATLFRTHEHGQFNIIKNDKIVVNFNSQDAFGNLQEILPLVFALNYQGHKTESDFISKLFNTEAAALLIYDGNTKQKFVDFDLIGFRPYDVRYPSTTFIRPDGTMGLMDKQGKRILQNGKPIRYTYIGPFESGLARVCIGGRLDRDGASDIPLPSKFMLSEGVDIFTEFNIKADVNLKNEAITNLRLYAINTPESTCQWAYIDPYGRLVFKPESDYTYDFNPKHKVAKIANITTKKSAERHIPNYGLVDSLGQELLDIKYNDISLYRNYALMNVDSTPTFYFTQKGHQIFINRTRLRPFSEGFTQFRSDNDLWGYVNTLGEIVVPPIYKIARPFSDGMALVVDSTDQCVFIDTSGIIAFRTDFRSKQWRGIGDFKNGRCWFKESGAWKWGCYDKTGKIVIQAKYFHKIKATKGSTADQAYHLPMDFVKNVAAVNAVNSAGQTKAAVIDTSGNFIVPPTYRKIEAFNELGLAVFSKNNPEFKGLINHKGVELCPPKYKVIAPFINGFARVQNKQGYWGLINIEGKAIVPPKYAVLSDPSEGMIAVKAQAGSGWSFIDTTNTIRLSGPFDRVTPFENGLTFVKMEQKTSILNSQGKAIDFIGGVPIFYSEGIFGMQNGKKSFYYADINGNNIFERYFSEIEAFQLGVAKVRPILDDPKKRALLGAINRRGVMVVPPKFRNLHVQKDGNIIINPQRYFGMSDPQGNILLEPIYDKIEQFEADHIFRVEQGEKIGYCRLLGNEIEWIWDLQN